MGNKALLLTKINLQNTFNLTGMVKAPVKAKLKMGLIAFAIVSLVVSFVGLMIGMFLMAGEPLNAMGMLHLLPTVCIMGVSLLIFALSIYKANSYLFSFRDFDLLMSLPVTERDVLVSKLSMLYFDNLLWALFGYVPVAIVYGLTMNESVMYYVRAGAMFFFVPVLPTVLGALVALPLAFLSARSRLTNVFMLIGSVALTAFAMWVSFGMNGMQSSAAVLDAVLSVKDVAGMYPPAAWLANALRGDVLSIALFVGVSLVAGLVFLLIYAKGFRSINAKMTERFSRASYKMQSLAVSSRFGALFKRELRGYFSSYIYVLNTAMGAIMATLYIGLLLFVDFEKVAEAMLQVPAAADMMVPVTLIVMALCAVMGTTTACSISFEGRTLWVLKSLPVRFVDIAKAKIALSLTISVPVLMIDTAVLAFVFKFNLMQFVSIALVVFLCSLMAALGGLVCNVLLPNLEWKSQVQAVKQSASVIVAMLMHFVLIAVPCALYIWMKMPPLTMFLFGAAGYLLAICMGFWLFLVYKGGKIFLKL